MFDHVLFGVGDYASSKAFFLKVVEPLGAAVVLEGPLGVELSRALDSLHTRDDFVHFVALLMESFRDPGARWENSTIESFLTALALAARNLEHYYDSFDEAARNVASPTWEAIAGLLFSARCTHAQR